RVGEVFAGVPTLCRRLLEFGVGEEAQPENAGRISVIRADRNGTAARADLHPGILRLVGERVGRTVAAAHVEQQPETSVVRLCRRIETRLVDQAEPVPPPVAIDLFGR